MEVIDPPSSLSRQDSWDMEFDASTFHERGDWGDDYTEMLSLFEDDTTSDGVLGPDVGNGTPGITGDGGDASSIMSELDLQSTAPPAAGWLEQTLLSQSSNTATINRSRIQRAAAEPKSLLSGGGGGGGLGLFTSSMSSVATLDDSCDPGMTASSTASISEFSDDSSLRSSISSRPAAHRRAESTAFTEALTASPSTSSQSSSVGTGSSPDCPRFSTMKPSTLRPRPQAVAPTAPTFTELARLTAAHAHSSVSAGGVGPLLPLSFMPSFHAGVSTAASGGRTVAGTTNTPVGNSVTNMPTLGGVDPATMWTAASGAASQVFAGLKRWRGDEKDVQGASYDGPVEKGGQTTLLPTGTAANAGGKGRETGNADAVTPAMKKRAKSANREERLMKNREAANRSRIKRKEITQELENRVAMLSRNLDKARAENVSLKSDIVALRERNSYLRGMLSTTGLGNDLPPILAQGAGNLNGGSGSTNSSSGMRRAPSGANGRGNGVVAGGGALVGAIGTALTVIACVALSASGIEDGIDSTGLGVRGGSNGTGARSDSSGGGAGRAGPRRTLLSTEDGFLELQTVEPIEGLIWNHDMFMLICLPLSLLFWIFSNSRMWFYVRGRIMSILRSRWKVWARND